MDGPGSRRPPPRAEPLPSKLEGSGASSESPGSRPRRPGFRADGPGALPESPARGSGGSDLGAQGVDRQVDGSDLGAKTVDLGGRDAPPGPDASLLESGDPDLDLRDAPREWTGMALERTDLVLDLKDSRLGLSGRELEPGGSAPGPRALLHGLSSWDQLGKRPTRGMVSSDLRIRWHVQSSRGAVRRELTEEGEGMTRFVRFLCLATVLVVAALVPPGDLAAQTCSVGCSPAEQANCRALCQGCTSVCLGNPCFNCLCYC